MRPAGIGHDLPGDIAVAIDAVQVDVGVVGLGGVEQSIAAPRSSGSSSRRVSRTWEQRARACWMREWVASMSEATASDSMRLEVSQITRIWPGIPIRIQLTATENSGCSMRIEAMA